MPNYLTQVGTNSPNYSLPALGAVIKQPLPQGIAKIAQNIAQTERGEGSKLTRAIFPLSKATWVILGAVGIFALIIIAKKIYSQSANAPAPASHPTPKQEPKQSGRALSELDITRLPPVPNLIESSALKRTIDITTLGLDLNETYTIDFTLLCDEDLVSIMANPKPTFTMRQAILDVIKAIDSAPRKVTGLSSEMCLAIPGSPILKKELHPRLHLYDQYCGVPNTNILDNKKDQSWLYRILQALANKEQITGFSDHLKDPRPFIRLKYNHC